MNIIHKGGIISMKSLFRFIKILTQKKNVIVTNSNQRRTVCYKNRKVVKFASGKTKNLIFKNNN